MPKSIWSDTTEITNFKSFSGEAKTDILIIGGGICGVLCAYFLQQEGVDYMLVEGRQIGSGSTKNTTAKITSQHGLIYNHLMYSIGKEKTRLYLEANEKAINEYRRLAMDIDCDFEEMVSGVYTRTDAKKIEEELKALDMLGYSAKFAGKLPLPFNISGAVLFNGQAQFHPLKFLYGISRNLNIYENTFVRRIDGHTAYTDKGKIIADKIIVATHFPFINKRGSYFLKLYQSRSYVIALKNAPDVKGMYVDAHKGGLSFRNYKDLLILGGGGGRTGKRHESWQMLREFAREAYPDADYAAKWAAQDTMSLDGIPYIGNYSMNTPYLYTASGFNKWGMSTSMAAAMILRDLVLGKENAYREVFSPSRNMLKPQLFVNTAEAVVNLLTPSLKRCPHMGCALKWNPQEHSWDCPCHGSRFERSGKLTDNPSTKNANVI